MTSRWYRSQADLHKKLLYFFVVLILEKEMKTKYSEVDKERRITDKTWVISIARKYDNLPFEHVFLILEGKKNEKALIWFIDFIGNPYKYGTQEVRQFSKEGKYTDKDLLFSCRLPLMDIKPEDKIAYKSWGISQKKANELLCKIKIDIKNPPVFNLFGDRSIFNSFIPSNIGNHNCFSWIVEKLHSLKIQVIDTELDEKKSIWDWYITSSKRLLGKSIDSNYRNNYATLWHQPCVLATTATVAVICAGVALANVENLSNQCKLS